MIGDEANAYIGTEYDEEDPRMMLFKERDLEWVPEEWQGLIRRLLQDSPEGVLVPLGV